MHLVFPISVKMINNIIYNIWCLFLACGICDPVSPTGGVIKSQNYPNSYGSSLNCTYEIGVPVGKLISLVFSDLNIEECCDYISVS